MKNSGKKMRKNIDFGIFKVKLPLVFPVLFLLTAFSCGRERTIEERMQNVLDRGIQKYNVHGVSATVILPDDTIWNGVSGASHDSVSIKPDMLFAIGSVTKNFVAALTLNLAEEEVLSLNDPLSKWLPSYPHVDGNITIRQLLNHTSGLYMFWDNQQIWDDLKKDRAKCWTPEEVLEYIQEPYFSAGEGWRYSNTNYLLLAMILNKATGSNLSTELKNRFCQPLGITDFYLSQEEKLPENLAHVYGDNFQYGEAEMDVTFLPRMSHESITYGSSGIFTTSENLALWSKALFGGIILKDHSLNEMLTFIKFNPVSNMRAYGLGVQEYTRRFSWGKRAIGHGGGNIGTTTFMVYLPDYQVSVVVMINAFPNKCAEVITRGLIKVVLQDLNVFGIFPYVLTYFDYYRFGYLAILAIAVWIIVITYHLKKRRRTVVQ